MAVLCGLSLHTYSDRTPLIQQADITAEQITCRLVEGGRLPPDDEILMAMKS